MTLAKVPHHAGAIVFREGNFVKAIASHDKKRAPNKYAVLRWGSSLQAMEQMKKDIAKHTFGFLHGRAGRGNSVGGLDVDSRGRVGGRAIRHPLP